MRGKSAVLLVGFLILTGLIGCRSGDYEAKLAPEEEKFLSEVRYLITAEEQQAFRRLSAGERSKFIEDFWRRRDPDPETPENIFRDEYYKRLSEASRLFMGEGREGWLTDRGRIYVLYGSPSDRQYGPLTRDAYGRCQEVWYYGNFPVVFIDTACRGVFVLATFDLSPIENLSLIRLASPPSGKRTRAPGVYVNFDVRVKKRFAHETEFDGLVEIEVPYSAIWLSAEGDRLKTTLELKMELKDSQNIVRWEHQSRYDISLTARELGEKKDKKFLVEVPIRVSEGAAALKAGRNKLEIVLRNLTGKEQMTKIVEFTLGP